MKEESGWKCKGMVEVEDKKMLKEEKQRGEEKGRKMEEERLNFSSLNVKVQLQLIYNTMPLS